MFKMLKESKIFVVPGLNYRKAKSHYDKNKVLADDENPIVRSMRSRVKAGQNPWDDKLSAVVVTIALLRKLLPEFSEAIPKEAKATDYAYVDGHCRVETKTDVLTELGLENQWEIPCVVAEPSSAQELLRLQLDRNEGVGVGARKTTTKEQFCGLVRLIEHGAPEPMRESEILDIVTVGRGVQQKLWSAWILAGLLVDGKRRMTMERPKLEAGEKLSYSAGCYVPVQSIRWQEVHGKDGLAANYLEARKAFAKADKTDQKQAAEILEVATAEARAKAETYVRQIIEGTRERTTPATSKDFADAKERYTDVESFGFALADALANGELATFLRQYNTLFSLSCSDVRALQASVVDAEAEA